jgi:hypothetical protein
VASVIDSTKTCMAHDNRSSPITLTRLADGFGRESRPSLYRRFTPNYLVPPLPNAGIQRIKKTDCTIHFLFHYNSKNEMCKA